MNSVADSLATTMVNRGGIGGEQGRMPARLDGDAVRIRLHHPARGVAKGQAAGLYDADIVLGSATISGTSSAPQPARSAQPSRVPAAA